MATKFETLKGKWISTGAGTEKQLINLDLYSKIYQTAEFNGDNMLYLIAFVKADSIPEFCFEYNNPEEWNTDFEGLQNILKNDCDIKIPQMDDKLKNYIERHRNWQNLALNQFSFINNLLLTISIGFLAFLFGKEEKFSMSPINWLHIGSFGFIILSIYEGIIVVISRLYDFRISRHVAYVRMRYYKQKNENEKRTLHDFDFKRPNFCTRVNAVCKVFFCRVELLTQNEIKKLDQEFYEEKFNSFRELSNTLGIVSWNGLKWQAFLLFFACLFFALNVFIL